MYIVLRPPWHSRLTQTGDRPPVVVAPLDGGSGAGAGKPVKKRRPRPSGGAAPGDPAPEEVAPLPLTAADRALEWRGDEVTRPAQQLDMSSNDEARSLDDDEIHQVIASQADGVKDCVIQGASNTDLHAAITVKLLVDGHGRITRSRVQAPHYLHEHGLLSCAQRAIGRMQFPATGAPTVVTLPVRLE